MLEGSGENGLPKAACHRHAQRLLLWPAAGKSRGACDASAAGRGGGGAAEQQQQQEQQEQQRTCRSAGARWRRGRELGSDGCAAGWRWPKEPLESGLEGGLECGQAGQGRAGQGFLTMPGQV